MGRGTKEIRDDEAVAAMGNAEHEKSDASTILLTLVQESMQAQDFELSQTERNAGGGVRDYLVVVKHLPSGTCCEHTYCCYHPLAGPVLPDRVTGFFTHAPSGSTVEYSPSTADRR